MTKMFHRFFMWKMDPISGFDIRLVFTLPPRDRTLQYKRCVHFWNNFPCITIFGYFKQWILLDLHMFEISKVSVRSTYVWNIKGIRYIGSQLWGLENLNLWQELSFLQLQFFKNIDAVNSGDSYLERSLPS